MSEWWHYLKGKPFYWAVDGTHPPADLFMLRHVIGRPERAPALHAARLALAESPAVVALHARLQQRPFSLWVPRYDTTLWSLRLLAEIGGAGTEEPVAEALDWLLDQPEARLAGEDAPIHANALVLHIALAFGFGEDTRVRQRLAALWEALAQQALPADPDRRADWLVLAAMALAEQPGEARESARLPMLARYLSQLDSRALTRYARYGFPTFDQPDDLMLARAVLRLGLAGQWLRPWVERIVDRQNERGQWHLERAVPTPGGVSWEQEGEPSRWITAQALYVLRAFYGE